MNNSNDIGRNKDLVRRCVEQVWNGGRAELIPNLVHPSFRRHHERDPDRDVYGQEGFSAWVDGVRTALPDLSLAILLLFAENDRVMWHLRGTATHRGELGGVPATGTMLNFTVTGVARIAEGKIAECWMIPDTLGIGQQLGVIPSLG